MKSRTAAHALVWISLLWCLAVFHRLGTVEIVPHGSGGGALSLIATLVRFHWFSAAVLGLHALALLFSTPVTIPHLRPSPAPIALAAFGQIVLCLLGAFSVGPYFLPAAALGEPSPEFPLEHEGIEDAFMGKGSRIHYCKAGKWHITLGAD